MVCTGMLQVKGAQLAQVFVFMSSWVGSCCMFHGLNSSANKSVTQSTHGRRMKCPPHAMQVDDAEQVDQLLEQRRNLSKSSPHGRSSAGWFLCESFFDGVNTA